MTINNTNSFTNVNNLQTNLLERISTGLAVNKASDDASGLAISDQLGLQKSSTVQAIENVNSGIAMSNIADGAISSQKELLENIKVETLKASNGTVSQEGRDAIANQIGKYIDQYEQIADSTNYNGESLLKTAGDASDDLSIVGADDSFVNIKKADTTSISDQLRSFLDDFTTNSNSRDSILDVVNNGMDKLASAQTEFGSSTNALESMARSYMNAQTNLAQAQSTILDIDYAKDVSDFNKTNIQTQMGFLAQSQGNAVQARTLALLS